MSSQKARGLVLDGYIDLLSAGSSEDLTARCVGLANQMGFRFISVLVVDASRPQGTLAVSLNNAPADYLEQYTREETGAIDPVLSHVKSSGLPILWDVDTYASVGKGGLWEEQAAFGYKTGVGCAVHGPDRRSTLVGVDRPERLPSDRRELGRIVSDLQLLAQYAHESVRALGLGVSKKTPPGIPPLTQRELEVLRWSMMGKTAWEIGVLFSITDKAVHRHVENARVKLGSPNKQSAVIRAIQLGLIAP